MAIVWPNVESFLDSACSSSLRCTLTSGGFDVPHIGHLRLFREARSLGLPLLVIVNGDGFLLRKKGKVIMPLEERLELVGGMDGVDHVIPYDDGTQFVAGAIRLIRPVWFAKGGDRSTPESIAEVERLACKEVGCRIVYGVGGSDKVQSSSWLAEKMRSE